MNAHNRFTECPYSEVIAELHRKDLDGTYWLPTLPDESEVKKCLSDLGQVRFFVYTKDTIYEVFINCSHGVDQIDGKMQDWTDEDWEVFHIPR